MASRRESKTAFVFYGGGSLGAVEVGMRRRSGASSSDLAQETSRPNVQPTNRRSQPRHFVTPTLLSREPFLHLAERHCPRLIIGWGLRPIFPMCVGPA